jgi:hypothetical protein
LWLELLQIIENTWEKVIWSVISVKIITNYRQGNHPMTFPTLVNVEVNWNIVIIYELIKTLS